MCGRTVTSRRSPAESSGDGLPIHCQEGRSWRWSHLALQWISFPTGGLMTRATCVLCKIQRPRLAGLLYDEQLIYGIAFYFCFLPLMRVHGVLLHTVGLNELWVCCNDWVSVCWAEWVIHFWTWEWMICVVRACVVCVTGRIDSFCCCCCCCCCWCVCVCVCVCGGWVGWGGVPLTHRVGKLCLNLIFYYMCVLDIVVSTCCFFSQNFVLLTGNKDSVSVSVSVWWPISTMSSVFWQEGLNHTVAGIGLGQFPRPSF